MFARPFIVSSRSTNWIRYNNYSTKLSYFHNPGKQPLKYITVGELLQTTAERFPERLALISKHQNNKLTFLDSLKAADKLAAGLHKLGLKKGERLGIWAPNLTEWYITNLACARSGLITVCLNPLYEPPELEYCINKVGIKALVCGDQFKKRDYYQILATIAPELEHSEPGKLKSTKVPSLETVITTSRDRKNGTYNFDGVLEIADSTDILKIQKSQHEISSDDPCNLHLTSGTTGNAKAALLSHFNLVNNAFLSGKYIELGQKHHTICMQVPFFHAFGTVVCVLAALHCASTLVLPTDGYQPQKSFDTIKDEKCSVVYGTPTMFLDLIEIQQKHGENVSPEIAVMAGALSSAHSRKNIKEKLNVSSVKSCYGMTETAGGIFHSLPNESEERALTTVGHVQEHIEVKVIDDRGLLVPFGTAGELCVRGYTNMLRYWNDKEKTDEILDADGWLKTGDQIILEENGYGNVIGRIKEMIIRGGENVFAKEIEDLLLTHPNIVEVYVIGTPHQRLGEEICACVRLKSESKITLDDITAFCKGKLASFKIPSRIEIMNTFPKTASGKVLKRTLKQMIMNRCNNKI